MLQASNIILAPALHVFHLTNVSHQSTTYKTILILSTPHIKPWTDVQANSQDIYISICLIQRRPSIRSHSVLFFWDFEVPLVSKEVKVIIPQHLQRIIVNTISFIDFKLLTEKLTELLPWTSKIFSNTVVCVTVSRVTWTMKSAVNRSKANSV